MVDLHHFFHIYADGNWQEPVSEHIKALKEYGLYEALTTLSIGFVGTRANQLAAHQYIQSQGLIYTIADEQESGWEAVTQQPMHNFSQNNDGLMLYAHSKGAYDGNEVNVRWRRSMTYWCVVRWKDAIAKMPEHESVGTHWIYPLIGLMPEHVYGNPMWAGNFYWVTCEQLRKWDKVPMTHRHESEGYIGYAYVKNPFRVYDFAPYFPNTNTFYDHWITNPEYNPVDAGKSVGVEEHLNRPK